MKYINHSASLLLLVCLSLSTHRISAKSRSRPSTESHRRRPPSSSSGSIKKKSRRSAKPTAQEEEPPILGLVESDYDDQDMEEGLYDDEDDVAFDDDEYDDYDEEVLQPRRAPPKASRHPPHKKRSPPPSTSKRSSQRGSSRGRYADDYPPPRASSRRRGGERDGRRRPSSRGRSGYGGRSRNRRSQSNSVVPYVSKVGSSAAQTFTRGMSALRESIPDPAVVRDSTASAMAAAKERTGKYVREVKGMLSSELEQVLLKSTRPDDTPVKAKHMERLIGITYQLPGHLDLYDPILRKLWSKMAEPDWRVTCKALYVLHRFSTDGGPDHASQLKANLRTLRRTKDPKRKEGKFFNSRQLLAGSTNDEIQKYRAFMARYAHYVLLRVQCFGGNFVEIAPRQTDAKSGASSKKKSRKPEKPITSVALRSEHLDAAKMILKAGCACALKNEEDNEITASCAERVAIDMNGLTTAVAVALNRALRGDDKDIDHSIVKKWCEFYSQELLPQTKSMIKKNICYP
uniref:ENTH domain-containing protein n=1 Tax=Leptocylindrus danicus TaxID=163516 RepID=A0A7S2LGQ7_9STRA